MAKIREGFWSDVHAPNASDTPWCGRDAFLRILRDVEDAAAVRTYRGASTCRVCHKVNGSREFETSGAIWPSGLRHYIEVHNVMPSREFQQHIEGLVKP